MSLVRKLEIAEHENSIERTEGGKAVLIEGRSVFDKVRTLKGTFTEFDESGNRTGHVSATSGPLAPGDADGFFKQSPATLIEDLERTIELQKALIERAKAEEAARVKAAAEEAARSQIEPPTPPPTVTDTPTDAKKTDPDVEALKKLQAEEGAGVGAKLLETLEEEAKGATTEG